MKYLLSISSKPKIMSRKFKCPTCKESTLQIIKSLDLGADERSDEVAIQCVKCENCEFRGMTIYEESRRGASDSFHHFGYEISSEQFKKLKTDIEKGKVQVKENYYHKGQTWFNMIFG